MITIHLLDYVENSEADRMPGLMFWDQVLQILDFSGTFIVQTVGSG